MSSSPQEPYPGNQSQASSNQERQLGSSASDEHVVTSSASGEDMDKEKNAHPMEWNGPDDPVRFYSPPAILIKLQRADL